MEDLRALHSTMPRDDWEDWTDEEIATPVRLSQTNPPRMVDLGSAPSTTTPKSSGQSATARRSKTRQSSPKIQRLKSRKRNQFQNEKLGIRLVTDMTRFRRGPQHTAQLVKPSPVPSETAGKFADASALRALEGSPNAASMGNWAWLRNRNSPVSARSSRHKFSPDGSKIVIGMALSGDDAAGRTISPSTATVATPIDRFPPQPTTSSTQPAHQPTQSAWSPDTEDGWSPARYLQVHPNIYAQSTGQSSIPPVPAVPSDLKTSAKVNVSKNEFDDDDDCTPVTLFEEDGGKSPGSALSRISPETTRSRSGWWDHVKTPFKERFSPNPSSAKEATSPDEWWKSADEKKSNRMPFSSDASASTLRPMVPIIREPSPTIASSSRSSPPASVKEHAEKTEVAMAEHADAIDVPPPYERTPSEKQAQPVRFRAVFPPSHPLASQFPPSPMPGSPGFSSDMAAKGDIKMSDVPLTPALAGAESVATDAPLPDRVAGTYVGDQFPDVHGDEPAAQIEKTRRRHEKEDYLARKAGGFWKGRGCLPAEGCYGRSGREGRQRRRMWLFVCLAFWLLVILGVVLGVVLSRKLHNASAASSATASPSSVDPSPDNSGSDSSEKAASVWLNLTSFPAIPTGLATVVGPDNSEAITGCVEPAALWSCSLPPEQQAANEPSKADQPTFVFQIQYDNNTRQLWNIPNGDAPTPDTTTIATATSTKSASSSASASSTASATSSAASTSATEDLTGSDLSRRGDNEGLNRRDDTLYDTGIAPNPAAPSYDEMWFLGNWTDNIVSSNKSGEPTPFYISFFTNTSSSAGPNMLTDSTSSSNSKRGGIGSGTDSSSSLSEDLPSPILNSDGTGAAAQLRPYPFQQPLRLFDRGLDTEHYGFYSYFNKTIYVSTMDNTSTTSTSDDGGVLESSASWYATWTQTRFVVKIWTRKGNNGGARLIGSSGSASGSNTTSPGSFPYPITIGEDTHGGNLQLKRTFAYGVESDQHINTTQATTFTNNIGYGSEVINAAYPNGDTSWGGTDGGTGGCRCEWVNWVDGDGNVDTSFG